MSALPFLDVRRGPPTAEELKRRKRWAAPCSAVACLLPALLCALWLIRFGLSIEALFLALCTTVFGGLFAGWMCSKYDAVDDDECIELVKLCAATPEGIKYRNNVVSLGREFVRAERGMLISWNVGKAGRDARQALYRQN